MPVKTTNRAAWKIRGVLYRRLWRAGRIVLLAASVVLAVGLAAVLWGHLGAGYLAFASAAGSEGPTVRVGIVRDSTHVRVICYGPFDILSSAGRPVFTCAGANVLRLSAVGGQPGKFYYYVVVAEFDKRDKPKAQHLLGQLREALKVGMEILETSSRLAQPKERAAQGKTLLVAVGPFDDLNLADQWKQYLARSYGGVYIAKDTSKRATGEIHVFDRRDKLLARMKDSVAVRPKDGTDVLTVEALKTTTGWAAKRRTTSRYRGSLEILLNGQGRLTAIDTLSVEEYVKGVVPSEIGGSAPPEALKAQAIAARSEALHKLGLDHHLADMFDFCAGPHCQTYHGVDDQTAASTKAVDDTRGQVLTYNRRVIDAVYCHSCGGVSADSRDVWRSGNYPFYQAAVDRRSWRSSPRLSNERRAADWLRIRPDVFCNADQRGFPDYAKRYFRWTRTLSGPKLERQIHGFRDVGRILDIQVLERAESGRVRRIRVVGSKESVRYTMMHNICMVLGDLPSPFFVLEAQHDPRTPHAITSLTIRGGGFGHGVGLCQMGAYMMARRGYSAQSILIHYYPETRLGKAY